MKIETIDHVNSDGSLDLHLVTNLPESEVKIIVTSDESIPNKEVQQAFKDIEQKTHLTKLESVKFLFNELKRNVLWSILL